MQPVLQSTVAVLKIFFNIFVLPVHNANKQFAVALIGAMNFLNYTLLYAQQKPQITEKYSRAHYSI